MLLAVATTPVVGEHGFAHFISQMNALAILIGGLAALAGVLWTVRQKQQADARTEWWKRAQWAVNLAMDPSPDKQAVGTAVIDALADSKLATDDELDILFAAAQAFIPVADLVDTGGYEPHNEARGFDLGIVINQPPSEEGTPDG